MLSIHGPAARLCDRISRRELLRVGALGVGGLALPGLLAAREATAPGVLPTDKTFGRAKSVIFLYLCGGPPQHETFDPKPDAPADVRGPFGAISTNVPGIQFCELLPRTARIADRLAVVRSIATDDATHSSSGYWVLTGYKYQGPNPRTIQATDRPSLSSIVKKLRPSDRLPPLSCVWLPDRVRQNENVTPAGQTGGMLGRQWDPNLFTGDPSAADYEVPGLRLSDLPPLELKRRVSLLEQINRRFDGLARGDAVRVYSKHQQQALELLTTDRARRAFELRREPAKVRDRYGRDQWAQCLLLARRLVEAGVRLVHVNWPRAAGDNAVDNPLWDTHAQNADRLEDSLCPRFDVGFTALVEDLDQRGLLDETLVVAIGEFGRTPKINNKGGRDHWGNVFSFVMAGAGIAGGQVYGASDKTGAQPIDGRVTPGDLTATIYHLLGIPHQRMVTDREGREIAITAGKPIYDLLGTEPATSRRVEPGGKVSRVPPYDESLLLNTEFAHSAPLYSADGPSRPKGWRASPLYDPVRGDEPSARLLAGGRQVEMGFGLAGGKANLRIPAGARVILAQEVRSPFSGRFRLTARVSAEAADPKFWADVFQKHFACRLEFYEYTDAAKKPLQRKQLATTTFQPPLAPAGGGLFQEVELVKNFVNPKAGANFSFGLGLGVAVIVEKTTPGPLDFPAGGPRRALIRVDRVHLQFAGKPRDDKVTV